MPLGSFIFTKIHTYCMNKKEIIMKKYILRYKGILVIALLFGAIFSIGSTMVALILKEVIDVAVGKDMDQFVSIVLQTGGYLAVLGVCYWLYDTFSKKFICKATKMLRGEAFEGIFKKNISDFKAVNSADYLSALTNDVKNVEENYFIPLLLCLQNILVFLTSFVVMLYLSPLVMLCLFVAILLLIAVPSIFQGCIQKRQNVFSQRQSRLTVAIKDFLSGFEVIRSYRMNSHIVKAFGEENKAVYCSKYALDRVVAAVEALSVMLGIVVQCSVLFVSAYLIIKGKITAGALVGLVQLAGTIVEPIQILSQNVPKIQGSKPIIKRLSKFAVYKDNAFTGTMQPTFQTGITVKDLHFGYTENQAVIKGINIVFQKGKKYAVVGKSGCGKTTLINLLTGYYAGFQGEVQYDNVDMQLLDIEKLNEMSSVIHQNVYMFDESIRDNICLHKKIEDQDLEKALEMSGVELFLGEGKGLDTQVGEEGNCLSGGQRQRIAVARALVQKKPLLILDEGTSAIDMQTAYDIESQLLKVKELTVITITHSLNPELLENYDQIIFMENGTIQEADSFSHLMEVKGRFYDFYN